MNSFLLSLTVFLIVALSALFAVPYFVDFNDYRDVFEAQASKVMGRDVAVRGPVELRLLPVPELRFDQVTVAAAEGGTTLPFIEAETLQVSLNIGALLRGTIETQQVAIVDPVIRLSVNEDGSGAWTDIGLRESTLPFAPKQVAFDSVTVSGGRIEVYKQGEDIASIEDIDGEATAASLSGPYKVSATYRYDGEPQEIHFSTGAADSEGESRLKARITETNSGTTLLLDGQIGGLRATPYFDGKMTARLLPYRASPGPDAVPVAERQDGEQPAPPPPPAAASLVELKGDLEARPERVALSPFEVTVHSRGRSQMLKGKLAVDFGETDRAEGEVTARWVDVDALLADPKSGGETDPASRLARLADLALQQTARFDTAQFDIRVDQASLGGDLVTEVDLKLASQDGRVTIEGLDATLPGETKIAASGTIATRDSRPVFSGKLNLEGKRLATLTRWAAGDRGLAGQTSAGDFSLKADAELSPDTVDLSGIEGAVSGTAFGGALRYEAGDDPMLHLALESERLDLREVMGEGGIGRLWSKKSDTAKPGIEQAEGETTGGEKPAKAETGPFPALGGLTDASVHLALDVHELLLPDLPGGALNARLDYAGDRLDIRSLEFESPGALMVTGEGALTSLSDDPRGRIALSVKGDKPESLQALADTLGLGDRTFAGLAPVDLRLVLEADREGEQSIGRVQATGTVKGAKVDLQGEAHGDLTELGKAAIDLEGEVDGVTSETLISLAAPDLSAEELKSRLGDNAEARNTLVLAVKGVPEDQLDLSVKLTGPLEASFAGEGAYGDETLTLQGQLSARTDDAAMVLALAGVSVPPSARDLPVDLRGKLTKKPGEIHLYPLNGQIGSESVELGAHILTDKKPETEVYLDATADTVSLPALLGPLVAWERTASTEELLGTLTEGRAAIWPARGFALGPLGWAKTQLHVKAKTMYLGSAFPLKEAQFKAQSNAGKLDIKVLKGKLFDGLFTAAGQLAPRGEGAHLDVHAELAAAKMSQTSNALLGRIQAKSQYGFNIHVTGDGLSPPGLIAGLSGKGRLALRPGEIRGLNTAAYAKMLSQAVKTDQNRVNEKEIVGLADRLQKEINQGVYHFDATVLDFTVQNGTLRLKKGRLANDQAITEISGLIALASLRLDSEWNMTLRQPPVEDAPPLTLVLAAPLEQIDTIAPRIDTDALVAHFTVRRMEEDVERLENLDVTGQGPPDSAPTRAPKPQSSVETPAPEKAEDDAAPAAEAATPQQANTVQEPEPETAQEPAPNDRDAETAQQPESRQEPSTAQETPPAGETAPSDNTATAPDDGGEAGSREEDSAKSRRTPSSIEDLLELNESSTSSEGETPLTEASDETTEAIVAPERRPPPPATRRSNRPAPANDDWKRGIPLFGYGR
ncbi:putative assembly protein [Methyloligella halotolerans]|uniref:Putative assembly protein n=1 Tax=Methyloligella halotolerans TaxID=1177755 RepID=A0A1E2S3B0_9HYPH|nr:AsmA family protein [Methyloligella halotolerans]ODA68993.1 putative assembly protein [Methyloligella halotolerans]